MKRKYFISAVATVIASSMMFTSCIGSFTLSNKVLSWNKQVGDKFVNELVFFAFWILPVYEITAIADVLVLNSIEFWSGTNPMEASTKTVETENGRFLVECDGNGYNITNEADGTTTRLSFDVEEQTWSIDNNGELIPFMTFVDNSHVRMITPDGSFTDVELSAQGVYAYREMASPRYFALR